VNWRLLRNFPWVDTRARFVANTPRNGTLLDIGASDGETLNHFAELRPDLKFFATDIAGSPEKYPAGTECHRGNLERDALPWTDNSFDSITCMHLVEHVRDHALLFSEISRLLRPKGRVYVETPHPKTLKLASAKGNFTVNFFDDPTHVDVVTTNRLAELSAMNGLRVTKTGISRNLIFAAAYPFYFFGTPSRQRFTALTHWIGWSAYLIAEKLPR
jgi:2-polyprenyl-3-methyl-5-hydroxy-6-metoxy-1,4-benzoquinol methylase